MAKKMPKLVKKRVKKAVAPKLPKSAMPMPMANQGEPDADDRATSQYLAAAVKKRAQNMGM